MLYQAAKKIPGGKLVRVKIRAAHTIQAIQICGDFFLHPEESLPEIEQNLIGLPVIAPLADIAGKIHEGLARGKAAFIGADPDDIAGLIVEALNSNNPVQ